MRVLRIRDPIPIQIDYDIAYSPYMFEYNWTSVNNTFVNFNQSYLELQVETSPYTTTDTEFRLFGNFTEQAKVTREQLIQYLIRDISQQANTYCIIDSVDVEMVYGLPDGSQRALKYHEPCVHATRGRKMIVLKDASKDELDKSVYAEDLSTNCANLRTLKYIRMMAGKPVTIAIPLNLICGLGTDADTLINVKHLKMLFRTTTLDNIVECKPTAIEYPTGYPPTYNTDGKVTTAGLQFIGKTSELAWFQDLKLKSVNMNLMTYQNVQFNSNELYKTVPSYVQVDYQYEMLTSNNFLVNRALPYIPEYILFWFTKGFSSSRVRNDPLPGVWPKYISCLLGNTQMFPQTEFPIQNYGHNLAANGKPFGDNTYSYPSGYPNKLLYSMWADHSNPETKLTFEEWMKCPIFLIPCNAMMDVRGNSGIELNMECQLDVNVHEMYYASKMDKPNGILADTEETKESVTWAGAEKPSEEKYNTVSEYKEKPGYTIASHNGYVSKFVTQITEQAPVTLHMLAVRTIRDV